ncbi:hypothetical protein MG293_000357 [Ovis ammon polii]|uniref:Uncharacterized protein n=1 Tax=Ovis ammon polii TaxID=230172 RepID=A0AAD4UK69_OVIAM|nr:hypothetical protein MG293_000357 [Ovis ammon polii]
MNSTKWLPLASVSPWRVPAVSRLSRSISKINRKLALVFWWVELDFFSLECSEVSSSEFLDVCEFGVTLDSLYIEAQGCVPALLENLHDKIKVSERELSLPSTAYKFGFKVSYVPYIRVYKQFNQVSLWSEPMTLAFISEYENKFNLEIDLERGFSFTLFKSQLNVIFSEGPPLVLILK